MQSTSYAIQLKSLNNITHINAANKREDVYKTALLGFAAWKKCEMKNDRRTVKQKEWQKIPRRSSSSFAAIEDLFDMRRPEDQEKSYYWVTGSYSINLLLFYWNMIIYYW